MVKATDGAVDHASEAQDEARLTQALAQLQATHIQVPLHPQ